MKLSLPDVFEDPDFGHFLLDKEGCYLFQIYKNNLLKNVLSNYTKLVIIENRLFFWLQGTTQIKSVG
jgi:hypothetical protein